MDLLLRRSTASRPLELCARCLRQPRSTAGSFSLRPNFQQRATVSRQFSSKPDRSILSTGYGYNVFRQLPGRSWRPVKRRNPDARGIKTIQEANSRFKIGPFSGIAVALFLGTGVGMYFYFRYEKGRVERKRIADMSKGVGKPKVGGPFELTDQHGKHWSSDNMKGKFSLVYFGFSHCPDICPEELDKMADMLDIVTEKVPPASSKNPDLLPIFITCDPARDTPEVLKEYLKEFHPGFIGLTGAWEQIKTVCKLYRVYFSTPPGVKPGMDYLVDHSIYFYLMDPEGDFVEAIGRQHTAEEGAKLIVSHMSDWNGNIKK